MNDLAGSSVLAIDVVASSVGNKDDPMGREVGRSISDEKKVPARSKEIIETALADEEGHEVPAPGKTLGVRASSLRMHIFRFADDFFFQDAKGKPINHDCQWWTKEYVRALVAAGVMPTEVLAILDNVPQNL